MSHHFDTTLAKDDPRLNLCDFYLFAGRGSNTVMAITVNPDVGLSTPDVLHPEGLYAIRFDLNGDAREDLVFKFRFGSPRHAPDNELQHIQPYQVRTATGPAIRGDAGSLLIEGETGTIAQTSEIRAFAGTVPELFAGNASGLHTFLNSFFKEHRYNESAFSNRQDFFARRNNTALILEVPNRLIGHGKVHAWATVSLYGHAPEVQVQRWGLPLLTHLFLNSSEELKDKFNSSVPADDVALFSKPIAELAGQMAAYAGSAGNPAEYGKQVADRLCPAILPYEIGSQAAFDYAGFNGRPIGEDVMDVMLTLAGNKPLADGATPDRSRIRKEFPYFGEAYTKAEQMGVVPVARPSRQ
jgi:Domain of unknown function (DUF4331)